MTDPQAGRKLQRRQAPQATHTQDATAGASSAQLHAGGRDRFEFRPAAWVVVTAKLISLWLLRPTLGKRALAGLAWSFLPRRLKLIALGALAAVFLISAASIAAVLVLIGQLA